jgi:hypothetical protein
MLMLGDDSWLEGLALKVQRDSTHLWPATQQLVRESVLSTKQRIALRLSYALADPDGDIQAQLALMMDKFNACYGISVSIDLERGSVREERMGAGCFVGLLPSP